MEYLTLNGLEINLQLALKNEEYEKANYLKKLIIEKEKEPVIIQKKELQINEILDNFDFQKVHQVMKYINHQWAKPTNNEISFYIPSIERLKLTAIKLLNKIWDEEENEYCFYASGGFVATRLMYNGLKRLKLEFVLANWEIYFDEIYEG